MLPTLSSSLRSPSPCSQMQKSIHMPFRRTEDSPIMVIKSPFFSSGDSFPPSSLFISLLCSFVQALRTDLGRPLQSSPHNTGPLLFTKPLGSSLCFLFLLYPCWISGLLPILVVDCRCLISSIILQFIVSEIQPQWQLTISTISPPLFLSTFHPRLLQLPTSIPSPG